MLIIDWRIKVKTRQFYGSKQKKKTKNQKIIKRKNLTKRIHHYPFHLFEKHVVKNATFYIGLTITTQRKMKMNNHSHKI